MRKLKKYNMSYAIFLDVSGTLIKEPGDKLPVSSPSEVELCDKVVPALKWMQGQGYSLIGVSNMSSIARGERTEGQIVGACNRLIEILNKEGIKLTQIYICPHDRNAGCLCRKPKTLMLEIARDQYIIDINQSYMIGNLPGDVETGNNAGCKKSFLVGSKEYPDILEITKHIAQLRH